MALSNDTPNRRPFAQLLGLLSILAGIMVAAGGIVLAILLALSTEAPGSRGGHQRDGLSQAVAVGGLGLCLGAILIAEGIRRRRGIPSATFYPRRSGWLWLAFALFLVAGTVASLLGPHRS